MADSWSAMGSRPGAQRDSTDTMDAATPTQPRNRRVSMASTASSFEESGHSLGSLVISLLAFNAQQPGLLRCGCKGGEGEAHPPQAS